MSASSDPQSQSGLKEHFFRHFQEESSSLKDRISQLEKATDRGKAVDECLAGIERLNHEVKDAASYIPAYDRRTYADAIKALSDALQTQRTAFAPPKKFQFKSRRAQPQPQASTSAAAASSTPSTTTTPSSTLVTTAAAPTTPPAASPHATTSFTEPTTHLPSPTSNTLTLSHLTYTRLTIPPPSSTPPTSPSQTPPASLTHLSHTILLLPTLPLATVTLKTITHSLLYIPLVTGPLHITNVHDSVLVVACHQFRMHNCSNVRVYLHCGSRPIVEGVRGVEFAAMPESLEPPSLRDVPNRWNQINDFDWLKSEPSPHFHLLTSEEKIPEEKWADILTSNRTSSPSSSSSDLNLGESVDNVLKAVGIMP